MYFPNDEETEASLHSTHIKFICQFPIEIEFQIFDMIYNILSISNDVEGNEENIVVIPRSTVPFQCAI